MWNRLWYKRRPPLADVHSSGGSAVSELLEETNVLRSMGEKTPEGSEAKETTPTNESHKEDFDALLKRAVQVK